MRTKEEVFNLKKNILKLHQEGISSVRIGDLLNRDHSTILYHLKKMGIIPNGKTNYHKISNVNPKTMIATCELCGEVKVYKQGNYFICSQMKLKYQNKYWRGKGLTLKSMTRLPSIECNFTKEKINSGKTYTEYLKEQEERDFKRLTEKKTRV